MSLENIQLSSFILPGLYKKTLVNLNSAPTRATPSKIDDLKFLGGNNKQIILLVKNAESLFLTDQQLKFLTEILTACKFTLNDVAVLNLFNNTLSYKKIADALNANTVIMFDILPSEIELPFNIPIFQKQSYNNQLYLIAPALDALQSDKELKRRLWASLQQIFSL